jgi:hypothetical protein
VENSGAAATALFVELLVIGTGALLGLLLLISAVVGLEPLAWLGHLPDGVVAIFGVATSYALGIVVDRIGDRAFRRFSSKLRSAFFTTDNNYRVARKSVLENTTFAQSYLYTRSRLRVVRGWSINSIAITIAGIVLEIRQLSGSESQLVSVLMTAALGVLLTVGFVTSWRSLAHNTYRNISRQYLP